MASAAEAMGMTLPGSSSFPAEYPDKLAECDSIGDVMRNLLEKNILPRDIMTRAAFENAMVSAYRDLESSIRSPPHTKLVITCRIQPFIYRFSPWPLVDQPTLSCT